MATLNIRLFGDELLRKKSREVSEMTPKLLTLLDDMRDTLIKANGVGLAAPQVGILRRIFIIDAGKDDRHNIIEFINPVIVKTEGHQEAEEGCLSNPGQYGITSRPMTVTVKALDRNGKEFSYTGTGIYARCLCHETDHLDGKLFTDCVIRMLDEEDID